jgi:hypothetical protein
LDLALFIAELRELPGQIKDALLHFKKDYWRFLRAKYPRHVALKKARGKIASDWLALNFGWMPLLSDVVKLYTSVKDMDKHIHNFMRMHDRWQHRGGTIDKVDEFDTIKSSLTNTAHSWNHSTNSDFFTGAGSYDIYRKMTRTAWFSAMMKYYIPDISRSKWKPRDFCNRVLRTDITPETLYNLIPFSWLADWFSNLGDVVSNISDYKDLVCKYAYVMCETDVEYTIRSTVDLKGLQFTQEHHTWTFRINRKSRRKAHPFGFNIVPADLSPRQISILLALGLS